jgi:hypothetical protein
MQQMEFLVVAGVVFIGLERDLLYVGRLLRLVGVTPMPVQTDFLDYEVVDVTGACDRNQEFFQVYYG